MELGLRETNELGWVVSLEGKQTVIASYWSVSNSHIKKSSRDVREWWVTQDLKFCPSAVVGGSFIKTAMTCSQTGGMEGGAEGVINVGMLAGGLAVGVEASGGGGEPEGVSGDTRPLGVVDMMVGSGYRWRPGKGEGSKKFLLGLGLER